MSWVMVERVTARQMVWLASQRAKVKLRDGKYAVLVRWPSSHSNSHRGWQVRLENGSGVRYSLHAREVEAVEVKEGQL